MEACDAKFETRAKVLAPTFRQVDSSSLEKDKFACRNVSFSTCPRAFEFLINTAYHIVMKLKIS